jgi:hypothetical protein
MKNQGYGWTNAVHPDDTQPTVEAWNEGNSQEVIYFEHRVREKMVNGGILRPLQF